MKNTHKSWAVHATECLGSARRRTPQGERVEESVSVNRADYSGRATVATETENVERASSQQWAVSRKFGVLIA